jgi:hypothetical protein
LLRVGAIHRKSLQDQFFTVLGMAICLETAAKPKKAVAGIKKPTAKHKTPTAINA